MVAPYDNLCFSWEVYRCKFKSLFCFKNLSSSRTIKLCRIQTIQYKTRHYKFDKTVCFSNSEMLLVSHFRTRKDMWLHDEIMCNDVEEGHYFHILVRLL